MSAIRKRINLFSLNHQEGAALVIAVMILLILTVVGIYAVTTSTLETKISGFEKSFKEAFYSSDSGEPMGIELTKTIIHDLPEQLSDFDAPWDDVIATDLFLGTDPEIFTDGRNSDQPSGAPDINSTADGTTPNLGLASAVRLRVDIDRVDTHAISGGATEFGSGYEGIGSGGGGDIGISYAIDSLGQTTFTNAESKIEAGYFHVIGVAGGE